MSEKTVYEFTNNTLAGQPLSLREYKGKVMLIVNTASECGLTPQYKGLEALYQKFKDRGFTILGFPCNQFGGQEPGTAEEIHSFCERNYGVSFPMFEKIDVNGENTDPLYVFLKNEAKGLLGTKDIKWNFTKFLIDREGKVLERFAPTTEPHAIEPSIEKLL